MFFTGLLGLYVDRIIAAIIVIVCGLIIIKAAAAITKKAVGKTSLDEVAHKFIVQAVKVVLYIVLIVAVLGCLGVPTAPLVTVLGAAGAAIALALKDSLGNIAGGMLILANKPFKKGDYIDVAGVSGTVESIDLFVTTLKTVDNKVVTVPNGTITTSALVNYSKEAMRRVDCTFEVSYGTDIAKAKDILLAVAESTADIRTDIEPIIGIGERKGAAILLDLKVWCETSKYFDVKYYLEEQVKLAFDEANITIPRPRMDVRVTK